MTNEKPLFFSLSHRLIRCSGCCSVSSCGQMNLTHWTGQRSLCAFETNIKCDDKFSIKKKM